MIQKRDCKNCKLRVLNEMSRIRVFFIFTLLVGALIAGALWFIQTRQFATIMKTLIAKSLPSGMDGELSEFGIKFFPPGLIIKNPRLEVKSENFSLAAERIELRFLPLQLLSKNAKARDIKIVGGIIKFKVDLNGDSKKPQRSVHWDELYNFHTESVSLENTHVGVELFYGVHNNKAKPGESEGLAGTINVLINNATVSQWYGKSGLGYAFDFASSQLQYIQSSKISSLATFGAKGRVSPAAFEVDSLKIVDPGLDATVSGSVQGNVLAQQHVKQLPAQVLANIKGDFNGNWISSSLIREIIPRELEIGGEFSLTTSVKVDLLRIVETFKVEGDLEVKRASFKSWKADLVKLDGEWRALAGGTGSIAEVSKLVISSEEEARPNGYRLSSRFAAGSTPGGGGRIEVAHFRFPFGTATNSADNNIPIKLERAHLHWLVPMALKDIYPLDFRVSGTVDLNYASGPVISAKNDLVVEEFQLDNQRYLKAKPLRRILKIPRLRIAGDCRVDKFGIYPQNMGVSIEKTKLQVGGKIDFTSGFELNGSGPIDLKEIGEIADREIRGAGTLAVHVHGPSSRTIVDFDTNLQDAYYLKLSFGAFKGRITWDDAPDHLLFSNIEMAKDRTVYSGEGAIKFDGPAQPKSTLGFNINVHKGDIGDLLRIFDDMTDDLWWFPHTLAGPVNGNISVSGGLGLNELEILAKMTGSRWEYFGEGFRAVHLVGGYDKGKYYISDFKAMKRSGKIAGKISFDSNRNFDWDIRTENMSLNDFDLITRLDVPIRGNFFVQSVGSGIGSEIQSGTAVGLTEMTIRGKPAPPSQMSIKTENEALRLKGNASGGQGLVELTYAMNRGGKSNLQMEVNHLDISPVFLVFNPKLAQDMKLSGSVSGLLDLSFLSGEVDKSTGVIELSELGIEKADTSFHIARPLSFRIYNGTFELKELAWLGKSSEAFLTLKSNDGELDGAIFGTVDSSLAGFFNSTVTSAAGNAQLDFKLGGVLKAPTILGSVKLGTKDSVSLWVSSVESPFENITGAIELRQNVITVRRLMANLSGGRVSLDGNIKIFANKYPSIDLKGELNNAKLKVYPFQFVKVSGPIDVHGDERPYFVNGTLVLDSALLTEKVLGQKQSGAPKVMQYMPEPGKKDESSYPKFKLNIDITAERGVLVQNDLFDAELKGDLTIVNTIEVPRVVGTVGLVSGKMIFKNRVFQLQSASANFDNPLVLNPSFELTANTEVNSVKVQLYASGRIDSLKIDLSSNPVMPESEILSLLALGFTSSEINHLSVSDRSAMEQGEAASLLLHSLDFNREVQNKTGFQIQLDEAVNPQVGTSAFRPQTQTSSTAGPKIVIRKQIGEKIDLSYGSTVGVGNNMKEANAEIHVNPGFSILGVWDAYETLDAQEKDSYGLDLKWQKRFK